MAGKWRIGKHWMQANQHLASRFCCFTVELLIRGEWRTSMGEFTTHDEVRKAAAYWYPDHEEE